MRIWRPTAEHIRLLAIAVTLAGIVHICATFAMPNLTGSRALREFAATLPANSLQILAPIAPANQPLPFMSPDSRYAVCHFNTTSGPVSVAVTLPDAGWIMAMYNPEGDNFYHVTGQAGRRMNLSLLLVPPSEQAIGAGGDAQALSPAGAAVAVPARQGLLLVRAPERGAAYRDQIEAELKKSRCAPRRAG